MACPVVPFGMENGRGFSYNINSGREIFRCGTKCIKIYIRDVSLEKSEILIDCIDPNLDPTDIFQSACVDTVSGNVRERVITNWCGKPGASTALPNGSVLTTIRCRCLDSSLIKTHAEGSISVRGKGQPDVNEAKNKTLDFISMLGLTLANEGVLTDYSLEPSPADWLSFSVGYSVWKTVASTTGNPLSETVNLNFNNMQKRRTTGITYYDDTNDTDFANIITYLLGL